MSKLVYTSVGDLFLILIYLSGFLFSNRLQSWNEFSVKLLNLTLIFIKCTANFKFFFKPLGDFTISLEAIFTEFVWKWSNDVNYQINMGIVCFSVKKKFL